MSTIDSHHSMTFWCRLSLSYASMAPRFNNSQKISSTFSKASFRFLATSSLKFLAEKTEILFAVRVRYNGLSNRNLSFLQLESFEAITGYLGHRLVCHFFVLPTF